MLELFLKKTNLTIDGLAVLPPIRCEATTMAEYLLQKPPMCEGLVYRENGKDYLVREEQSFDITRQQASAFEEAIRRNAMVFQGWEGQMEENGVVYEVLTKVHKHDVIALVHRPRSDKFQAEKIGAVGDKLNWPLVRDLFRTGDNDLDTRQSEEWLEYEK